MGLMEHKLKCWQSRGVFWRIKKRIYFGALPVFEAAASWLLTMLLQPASIIMLLSDSDFPTSLFIRTLTIALGHTDNPAILYTAITYPHKWGFIWLGKYIVWTSSIDRCCLEAPGPFGFGASPRRRDLNHHGLRELGKVYYGVNTHLSASV